MDIEKQRKDNNVELAYLDDLTGIYNRRYLYKYLSEELPKLKKLSLFMMDLDGFKKVNDTLGHLEGDALLVSFSKIIDDSVKGIGIITRYAGDEFVAILPGIDRAAAIQAADKIIKNVSGQLHTVTASLGIAIYPDDAADVKGLVDKADQALYSSKRTGKNKFSTANDIVEETKALDKLMQGLASPVFVDREEEVARFEALLGGGSKQKEKALIFSGPKGIGKTRLLEELSHRAGPQGANSLILYPREPDLGSFYAVLIEGLSGHLNNLQEKERNSILNSIDADETAVLAGLHPVFKELCKGTGSGIQPDDKKKRLILFRALAKIFKAIFRDNPFVLLIDDFQWLDAASFNLISYLLRNDKIKLFLIAASLEGDRLNTKFPSFQLKPFSLGQIREMLALALAGTEAPMEFSEAIYNKTKGNPSFIWETVKLLVEEGSLHFKDGHWDFSGINKKELPDSLEDAAKERLKDLDPEAKEILINAAFLGEDFNLDILKKLSQKNEGYILDVIDRASKLGMVESKSPLAIDKYNFSNKQVKDTVCNFLDALKTKDLHKRIATFLESYYQNELGKTSDILSHYRDAGDKNKLEELEKKLSSFDQQLFSPEEAVKYLDAIPLEDAQASVEEILELALSEENKKMLPDVIIALRSAVESAFLYPANNQARLNFKEEAFLQLTKLLQANKSVTFSVTEGALLINGEELEKKELRSTLGNAFSTFLTNYRISSLTFKTGFKREEFSFFLEAVTKQEEELIKAGGLAKLLKENNIALIKIDQVRYEKAHKVTAQVKQARDIIKNLLLQYPSLAGLNDQEAQSFLKPKGKEELREIIDSLSNMIKNISSSPRDITEKADEILDSMEKIADPIAKIKPEEWQGLKNNLAQTFLSLDPGLQAMIIKKDLYNIGAPGAIVNDIIASSSDKDIINTVTGNIQTNTLSLDDITDMLKVIFSDTKRKERLGPVLEKELLQRGISQRDIADLLGKEALPEKKLFSRGGEELIKGRLGADSGVDTSKDAQSMIEELAAQGKEDVIKSLAESLLKQIEAAKPDARQAILNDLKNFLSALLSKEKYDSIAEIMSALGDVLKTNIDSEAFSAAIALFSSVLNELLYKESYASACKIIKILKTLLEVKDQKQQELVRDSLEHVIDRRAMDALNTSLNQEQVHNEKNITVILAELGSFAVPGLIKLLETAHSTIDPFNQFVKRRRIAYELKKIGPAAVMGLKSKLKEEDSLALKNIIEALGYLQDCSLVPDLGQVIKHPEHQIRNELVKTLKRLWSKESIKLLVELLKDEDSEVKKRAKNVLLEKIDQAAVPELEQFLADQAVSSEIREIINYAKKGK